MTRVKSINKGSSQIQCSNGILMMNMKLMLSERSSLSKWVMEVLLLKGEFMEYPPTLKTG